MKNFAIVVLFISFNFAFGQNTPQTITGLKLWVRSDSSQLSGSSVMQLYDLSGNGFHLIQNNVSKRPIIQPNALNGYPSVKLDGINDNFKVGFGTALNDQITVFLVAKGNSGANSFLFDGGTGFKGIQYFANNAYIQSLNTVYNYLKPAPFNFTIFSCEFNGIQSKIFDNKNFKTGGALPSNPQNGLTLGARYLEDDKFFNGEILEFILYEGNLTTANRQAIENYLHNRYAPPVNLGVDINKTDFCPTTITAPAGYTSYLWSNGATTPSITVTSSGVYTLTTTDIFGYSTTDQINVNYPTIQYPSNSVLCENSNFIWNPGLSGNFSYNWSNGSTSNLLNTSLPGAFTCLITDQLGCQFTTNTINVSLDNFPSSVSLGNDTSLCAGNILQVTNNPSTSYQYLWSTQSTLPSIPINNSGTYSVQVSNQNNCVGYDTIQIVVIGEAPVVSINLPSILCENSAAIFVGNVSVLSPDTINSVLWSFNDGTSFQTYNVSKVFNQSGNYSATLTAFSSVGCSNQVTSNFFVNPNPIASFDNIPPCTNTPVLFENSTTGTNLIFNWYLDGILTSNSTNYITSLNLGQYQVKLVATDTNQCMDDTLKVIQVNSNFSDPNPVLLSSPLPNQVLTNPSNTIAFTWDLDQNSNYYIFQLSTSSSFSTILVSDTLFFENTFQYVISLNGNYYWRVLSLNSCGIQNSSETRKVIISNLSNIANLTGWYKSTDGILLNAGRVTQWLDQSNSSFNLVQNTDSKGPLINLNQINGFPSVKFDGINDNLKSNYGSTLSNQGTVFLVGKLNSGANCFMFDGGAATRGIQYFANNVYLQALNTNFNYLKPTPFPYTYFSSVFNGSQSRIYDNGTLKATGNLPNTAPNGFTLGSRFQEDAQFMNGDIVEVINFSSALSDIQRIQVENYIRNKYAPPVNLGNDIYKTDFCPITLSAGPRYTSFFWSTGAVTEQVSINQPGIYHVTAIDIFGFSSSDTIQVFYPNINNPVDTVICAGSTIDWQINLSPSYTYQWSNGNSGNILTTDQDGPYFVTITDDFGCSKTSETVHFTIDNFPEIDFIQSDFSICSGQLVSLSNGILESNSVIWNTGTNGFSTIVDTSGNYNFIAANSNNCLGFDSTFVTIIGTSPSIQYQITDSLCQFSSGNYLDNSFVPNNNGTISNKTWSISEGSLYTGSSGDFVLDTAGIFNITLLVETQEGCNSSTTFPIVVFPKPILSFTTQNYCPYDAVEFNAVNSQISTLNTFQWNFGDNTSSTLSNPTHVFGTTGTYNVSLEAQDINGCRDTITQAVFIQPAPIADFSFNNTCEETGVNFVNNSNIADTFNITTNAWTYGDGTQAINPSFQKNYADADTFDVQLIVMANNGCQDTSLQSIIIYPRPTLDWQVGPACKNAWTTFENLSSVSVGSINQSDWLINLQYPIEGMSSAYQFVTTGVQYLKLTSTTDNGCQRDTLIIVNVQPEINASYTVSPQTIVAGVPTSFTSTSTGATEYTWNLGNGNIIQTTAIEPVEIPGFDASLIGDSIQTSLIIENTIGCKDTATQFIKIFEPRIDLAITQLFVQNLNGFYKVGVELSNQGFIEITQTDLVLKMYGSLPILETENESLAPGESRIYLFNASPSAYISTQDNETSYLCVEATSYNDYQLIETELSNNLACLNTEGENFVLLPIYPNPTNDDISYTLILSKEATLKTSLTDETGRIVMEQSELHPAGLHTQFLSMRNLSAGVYYFHISDGTSARTVKILKN
jgi:hypothetical protein